MARIKRLMVALALAISALLLHTTFCKWTFGAPGAPVYAITAQAPIPAGVAVPPGTVGLLRHGLVKGGDMPVALCVVGGVVVPLNLLFILAYLAASWKEQSRAARGRCRKCNYILAGAQQCPECGLDHSASVALRNER